MATVAQSTPTRNTVSYYAHLGAREGIAVRLPDRSCWFVDAADDSITLLNNADLPDLMLFGKVDLVAQQTADDYATYLASGDDQVILDWLAKYLPSALIAA